MKLRDSGMPNEEQWEGFFEPEDALDSLGLTTGINDVADIGCGYGTFSVSAAKRIDGALHVIDIEKAMLERTLSHARKQGLPNIKPHLRDIFEQGTGLPDASIDYVMLFNILHGEEPVRLLRESGRILRPGGRVGVMHWRSDIPTPRGPSLTIRPQPEQIQLWALDAGLERGDAVIHIGPFHFGMVLRKPKL